MKVKRFNELNESLVAKAIKSEKEFQQMKNEFAIKLDKFIESYNEFTNSISPQNWRVSGSYYSKLNELRTVIQFFKPLELKDLESEHVRREVLSKKEEELYNFSKKYNI